MGDEKLRGESGTTPSFLAGVAGCRQMLSLVYGGGTGRARVCGKAVVGLLGSRCTEFDDLWGILVERSSWIHRCGAQG